MREAVHERDALLRPGLNAAPVVEDGRVPLHDARELSDSAVRLARQTWAAPAGGDPVKAAACEEADDVDQLVLGEDVVYLLLRNSCTKLLMKCCIKKSKLES